MNSSPAAPSLGTTLRALRRLRRARRTRGESGGRRWWWLAALPLVVGAGALAAPDVIAPTTDGAVTHWGGWPLEAAFSGCSLVAAVVTFRVLEVLFRTHDARALSLHPLPGTAASVDRLALAVSEAAFGAFGVAAFVAPALLREGGLLTMGALAYCAVAAVLVPAVAFGVIVSAGLVSVDPGSLVARGLDARAGDRSGAVYHFAPGAAFGLSVSLLLFAKLGIEEPLRTWLAAGTPSLTRAAQVAIGAPLGLAAVTLAYALRAYARHHHALQARFVESEFHRADQGAALFSAAAAPAGRLERRLGRRIAALYRRNRLELSRAHPFVRAGTWLATGVALAACWAAPSAVSPSGLALLLGAWLAAGVAPARRLGGLAGSGPYGLAATLGSVRERDRATRLAVVRETVIHSLPLLAVLVMVGPNSARVVFAATFAFGLAGLLAAAAWRPRSSVVPIGLWALGAGVAAVGTRYSPTTALAVATAAVAVAAGAAVTSAVAGLPSTRESET